MSREKPPVASSNELLKSDESNPNRLHVPDRHIYLITSDPKFDEDFLRMIEPLAGKKKREWFTKHFYYCLPLVIGNQIGFMIRLLDDYVVRWDGGEDNDSLKIHRLSNRSNAQYMLTHFGHGILTLAMNGMFRTPKSINLWVGGPPNYPTPGMTAMNGIVETDNLRNDFTFNLKMDVPHRDIYLPAGTPLASVVPVERRFTDGYQIALCPSQESIDAERKAWTLFDEERHDVLNHEKVTLRYFRGFDIYGNPLPEHQISVDGPEDEENKRRGQ